MHRGLGSQVPGSQGPSASPGPYTTTRVQTSSKKPRELGPARDQPASLPITRRAEPAHVAAAAQPLSPSCPAPLPFVSTPASGQLTCHLLRHVTWARLEKTQPHAHRHLLSSGELRAGSVSVCVVWPTFPKTPSLRSAPFSGPGGGWDCQPEAAGTFLAQRSPCSTALATS